MPHHSGGGGHSSSHSQSYHFHSNRNSSYDFLSDSPSNSSDFRVSDVFFAGSQKYGYKDKYDQIHYVYSNANLTEDGDSGPDSFIKVALLVGLGLLTFIGILAALIFSGISKNVVPEKLIETSANYCIIDDQEIISNEDELLASLENFYDLTGIPVCVATLDIGKNRLYNYSYQYYVKNYSDEDHFVIVCSKDSNSNYNWEAVQGDNTDNILTSTNFDNFSEDVNKVLNSGYSIGDALVYAFNNSSEYMMEARGLSVLFISPKSVVFSVAFIEIIVIAIIFFAVRAFLKEFGGDKKYFKVENMGDTEPEKCLASLEPHNFGSKDHSEP